MATHSSVLTWRIPETEEPGGLPSMGSHRVGHDWSDLAAAAAAAAAAATTTKIKYPLRDNIYACRWYVCIYIQTRVCMSAKSLQVCQSLCDSMDCSPSGSSVHVILQARTLEQVGLPFPPPRDLPDPGSCISYVFCISELFISNATWEPPTPAVEYYSTIKRMKLCHLQQHGWS